MKLRVLIVDDAPFIHEVLENYLMKQSVEIVASAYDGEEAVSKAIQLVPDLVLMDLALPKLNGLDATIKIHNMYPQINVVAMSSMANEELICQALDAGCYDYLDKAFASGHLVEVIDKIKSIMTEQRGEEAHG